MLKTRNPRDLPENREEGGEDSILVLVRRLPGVGNDQLVEVEHQDDADMDLPVVVEVGTSLADILPTFSSNLVFLGQRQEPVVVGEVVRSFRTVADEAVGEVGDIRMDRGIPVDVGELRTHRVVVGNVRKGILQVVLVEVLERVVERYDRGRTGRNLDLEDIYL